MALDAPRSVEEVRAIAERIAQDPAVEYAEPDAVMRIQQVVNDSRFNEQWHYHQAGVGINLPAAWQHATGSGQVVAVLDTGITERIPTSPAVLPGGDFITDLDTAIDGDGRDADAGDPGDITDATCLSGARPRAGTARTWPAPSPRSPQ